MKEAPDRHQHSNFTVRSLEVDNDWFKCFPVNSYHDFYFRESEGGRGALDEQTLSIFAGEQDH